MSHRAQEVTNMRPALEIECTMHIGAFERNSTSLVLASETGTI